MTLYAGMQGLGDNLYQRAVVRELVKQRGPLHLVTSWPQLYRDIEGVSCVKPATKLRTQRKNIARAGAEFKDAPQEFARPIGYNGRGTMLDSMLRSVGLTPAAVDFSGPRFAPTIRSRPYIVIRPGTVRAEWLAAARNAKPEYLCAAAEHLRTSFDIVSVADLARGQEYPIEPLPFADERYHAGELHIEHLLSLVAGAAGVVGGVGWLFPAAVAYQVPMLLVYGGWGHVNGPAHIIDHRMDVSRVVQAMPDTFCMCNNRAHNCEKHISGFDDYLRQFDEMVTRGLL